MASSRLPRWRRISQIFFLLLFLALLVFTSLRPMPGTASDIHLRAPVRLFFEWDPLVALANALAGHALYRGLMWSLVILLPTLFLGRFFCGWICPMGTLQHFVGNMPSEAKRGKQRIDSNRYKRWQTIKYVVLIAGLVAAALRLDGDWLARSIQFAGALFWTFDSAGIQFCGARGGGAAGAQPRGGDQGDGRDVACDSASTVLDFRQAHFAQGLVLGILFIAILPASLRVTRLWCRAICPLGALLGAVSRWSRAGAAQGCGELRQLQPLPAPLPGRRRSDWRRALAQGRVPDVHELRGQLPASALHSAFPQRERSGLAGHRPAQGAHRPGRRRGCGAADARQHGHGQEPPRAAAASAGRAR